MKRQKVALKVNVGGIVQGKPPLLVWWKRARRPDGKEKIISQSVSILDEVLFQQLMTLVKGGDEIEICVVNEWPEGKSSISYLAGFAKDGQKYGNFDVTQEAA
ncbi:MAG: hypothetical protein M1358_00800 [Chloroflexi bacterium]|nr:hypothetical protein [Chloroflexota bacterium]